MENKSSILVVDDTEANRDLLARRLTRRGFDVETAANGTVAIELVADNQFDLVLLDLMMPGLSGLEVLNLLRKDHSASKLPVIVVTAQRGRKSVVDALQHGANDLVSKPIDFEILLARIDTQLQRKRAENELEQANIHLESRVAARTAELNSLNESLQHGIDEKNRIEGALLESQKFTNSILNCTVDAILVTDFGGDIEFINRAGEDMFGRSLAQTLFKSVAEMFDGYLSVFEGVGEYSSDEEAKGNRQEITALRTDGTAFPAEVVAREMIDDESTRILLVITDITNRKEAEDRLKVLAENTTDLITWRNLDGRYLYVSPSVEAQLGYTPEQVRAPDFPPMIHPDDADRTFSAYKDGVAAADNPEPFYRRLRMSSGEYKWYESLAQVVRGADGKVTSIVTASRDITERKLAEEQHEALEGQLRQSQKIESLGTLAGGIAHEFNNILMVVSGYISRALKDDTLSGETRDSLDEAAGAASRAASITKQLLVFSGKHVQETAVVELDEMLMDSEAMLVPLIGEQIKLVLDVGAYDHRVRIDADQMRQAVVNLVINARDAMGGAGQIVIGSSELEVDANFSPTVGDAVAAGRYATIYVEDHGCGMDEEVLQKVFDPFFSTKGPAGTGLGLAVIYGFVQESGGFIDVKSTLGEGTRFTICLPITEEDKSIVRIVDQTAARGNGETIMLVEDEDALRGLLEGDIRGLGYEVLSAADGAEALELEMDLEKPIDLLLSDVRMPGFSGPEVARALTQTQPDMKVIFMSGYALQGGEENTELPDGANFVSKPVDISDLAAMLRQVLDGDATEQSAGVSLPASALQL